MSILFAANGLLLNVQTLGLLWIFLLFALCFLAVHAVKLLRAGWSSYQKKPPQKEEKKKAPAKQEPVYYIVERKRRKPKSTTKNGFSSRR